VPKGSGARLKYDKTPTGIGNIAPAEYPQNRGHGNTDCSTEKIEQQQGNGTNTSKKKYDSFSLQSAIFIIFSMS